jgi:acyl-CoA synthetase (AMP-forming)/AMP-acid ligase II
MATAFLGVASATTCAPLNPAYWEAEYEFYLGDLGARAIVLEAGTDSAARRVAEAKKVPVLELSRTKGPAGLFQLEGLDSVARRAGSSGGGDVPGPDDIALVLHTSGTTSRPKIVPLSHRNLRASAQSIQGVLALAPMDRALNVMPLFHIHGLVAGLLAPLSAGGSVICTPGFNARDFFPWMMEGRPTWYTAVPTMHQTVLTRAPQQRECIEARPLRFLRSSSAALPASVLRQLEATFGAPVIEAYGMTEAAHQMACNPLPPRDRKPGSVGVAAGPEVAIMNEAGSLLPPGQIGEIVIRGPNVTSGYKNNDTANAEAFSHGWFRTGDQGVVDEDGYFRLTGRLKEIINRGGEKISPREVDEVLLDHPAVAQVVTFAVPHAKLGEDVAAAIVLRENAEADEKSIRAFASERLADMKVPRKIVFLDEIPKGATGKLQRIGLAEKLGLA